MRKLYFVVALILSVNMVSAQLSKNAFGLRLGGGEGYETEISFQHRLTDKNRLELDFGMLSGNHYTAWSAAGIYQWTWEIGDGFDWFVGAGGRIGSLNWDKNFNAPNNGGMLLAAVGVVGIEYSFPGGIQLGFDYRPELGLINHANAFGNNAALSIRYRF